VSIDKRKAQEEIERRLGQKLAEDSSAENFQKLYDEFHSYLLQHGVRDRRPNGCIYKRNPSYFDRLMLRLIGTNKRVLDIGCGDGALATACGQRDNRLVGTDVSTVAIRLANTKKGTSQAEFLVGDARQLAFPSNTFDIVMSLDLIEHIPEKDIQNHIEEVRRVLKPNGDYLLYTPSKLLGDLSLGTHLRVYGIMDLVPTLRRGGFELKVICLLPCILGLPCKTSSVLVNTIMAYERMLEKAGIGGLLGKLGNLGYAVIPPVWLCATKSG